VGLTFDRLDIEGEKYGRDLEHGTEVRATKQGLEKKEKATTRNGRRG
jgi:hypothetical protein